MKILLCGLNGAGKTTVGRASAKALHFRFLDVEELFFSKKDPLHPYADMRSSQEARALFSSLVTENKDLVFS